jgi:hypothetical protein
VSHARRCRLPGLLAAPGQQPLHAAAPRRPDLAVTALRRAGRDVDDAVLAHIWPTHHENVHFYGTHSVDVDGELAKLDADGYRPLRTPALAAARQD